MKSKILVMILLVFSIVLFNSCTTQKNIISVSDVKEEEEDFSIREPAFSGTWYPNQKEDLITTINDYFNKVTYDINGTIKAIIAPHAGYRYSGQVAATAYKYIDEKIKTVIILGPSHTMDFNGASLPNKTHFKTPLGDVKISKKIGKLSVIQLFQSNPLAHDEEHSIEIQIPFLQSVLEDFEIIPILIGASTTEENLISIAKSLNEIMDDETLIVVSSDFTHYGPRYGYLPFDSNIEQNLKKLDSTAVNYIVNKDPQGFIDFLSETKDTICGRNPITVLLYMAKGLNPEVIYYTTSGAITGDYSNSVSYVSIVFVEPDSLNKNEKELLLKLSRQTLKNLYYGEDFDIDEGEITPEMKKVQGCFTTLNKDGNLRGCIGHILPQEELYKCVIENSVNAALHDNRFSPVTSEEVDNLEIEISVLSVPENYQGDNLLLDLRPMIDGVVLKNGLKQSTYLPQVWEHFQNPEEFLSSLCIKGRMDRECWKDENTKVYTYQAEVFNE